MVNEAWQTYATLKKAYLLSRFRGNMRSIKEEATIDKTIWEFRNEQAQNRERNRLWTEAGSIPLVRRSIQKAGEI